MTPVNESKSLEYQANVFADGSALVIPTGFGSTRFFSRGMRPTGTAVAEGTGADGLPSSCVGAAGHKLLIVSGELQWWNCKTIGPELAATMDIDTDCTGFNKHLFD
jgi:hypothetical protein